MGLPRGAVGPPRRGEKAASSPSGHFWDAHEVPRDCVSPSGGPRRPRPALSRLPASLPHTPARIAGGSETGLKPHGRAPSRVEGVHTWCFFNASIHKGLFARISRGNGSSACARHAEAGEPRHGSTNHGLTQTIYAQLRRPERAMGYRYCVWGTGAPRWDLRWAAQAVPTALRNPAWTPGDKAGY